MQMFGSRRVREQDSADASASALDIYADMDFESAEGAEHPRSPREAIEPERVPLPADDMKARRNPFVAILSGLFSLIIFAIVIGVGAFVVLTMQLDKPGPLQTAKTVIVAKGSGVSAIAARLEREGVVSDANIFIAGALLAKATNRLQAGEFVFEQGASINDVISALVDGRAILHKITLPEGLTSQQIVERLNSNDVLTGDVADIPAEGTLLPDTYKFTRGTTRQEIINRMASEHNRVLARVWERRDKELPLNSPDELVTLASIVEKETGKADERPRVASVFINRLNKSIRLQSDPTIIYGLIGGKGSLGRPILRSEIDQETPYNTYKINGLPPTPIANPGIAALEATANPSHTSDIYFVADGTGGHVFASTLEEHNRNVSRWRQYQSQARVEAVSQDAPPVMVSPSGAVVDTAAAQSEPVTETLGAVVSAPETETASDATGSAEQIPLPTLRPAFPPGG